MNNEKDKRESMPADAGEPENSSLKAEPDDAAAPVETTKDQSADALPVHTVPEVSTPGPSELEAWNRQVRRRMQQHSRRSFLLGGLDWPPELERSSG